MSKSKPLTKEKYLSKFSRAARWRLPPQEAEEAISDYRELLFQTERDESKLVEELGEPIQAAHLLTDVKSYRRWLAVFGILVFGLFQCARWCWTGRSSFLGAFGKSSFWFPVWVMMVGLALSLFWFRRHGRKTGPVPVRVLLVLAAELAVGAGMMACAYCVLTPSVVPLVTEWQAALFIGLFSYGGTAFAFIALVVLILARCRDRRWLALYALSVTVAALCVIVTFWLRRMDLIFGIDEFRFYMVPRMIPVGIVGLLGTGVALC